METLVENAPLFSIIINNYNYGRYLNQAIDSALAQTYKATEVVVVDDGSMDDSRQRIDAYGDRLVKVYQPNGGQTGAMNAGLASSRGAFVIFLDADDALSPDVVEQAMAVFAQEPDTVLVHWRMQVINGDGRRLDQTMPKLIPDEGNHLRQLILTYGPNSFRRPPTSGAAWRRSYLDEIAPFPAFEKQLGLTSAAVDAYLSTLAPLYGTIRRLPTPSGAYRVHGKNSFATSSFDAKLSRLVRLYDVHCEALEVQCKKLGYDYSKSLWGSRSWPHLIDRSLKEMREVMNLSRPFILIDEAQWGMDYTDEHKVMPFIEKDGMYWGRPGNDRLAITELERLQAKGAEAVVVAWPAYWWLDHYPSFAQHLRQNTRCMLENDLVTVFDLTATPATR